MKKVILTVIFLTVSSLWAKAQFYTTGDDQGSLRWYMVQTGNYSIIYPEGLDSLAHVYGENLERYRMAVARTAGYVPGEFMRRKMPVILHAYNVNSNGTVVWAPRRVELYTTPPAYSPEPMTWEKNLAIHESRHIAQMQQGMSRVFKPFNWIFGQMWTGAIAGLYPSKWLLEGDAVVAETALSSSGRGRTADLLNWYMIAADNGDIRSSKQWKYGSYRYYTPNEYSLGYLFISGVRYLYDDCEYTARYLHYPARRPYDLFYANTVTRQTSGKNLKNTFREVMDFYAVMWAVDKAERAPFMTSEPVPGKKIRRYTLYEGSAASPEGIYTLRSGMDRSRSLMLYSYSGKEKRLGAFATQTSKLEYSDSTGRLYWSESVPDARWGHKTNSRIRYFDTDKGRKRTLTREGRLFNPSVSDSLGLVAATEYMVEGGSRIAVLDFEGNVRTFIAAPDSLQITESVWVGDRIFVSGISENGTGLYYCVLHKDMTATPLVSVLEPGPVKISGLRRAGGHVAFTSDRTGVNELYVFRPETGETYRATSTPYGAKDFQFSTDGKRLYHSVLCHDGAILSTTDADSLQYSLEDFSERYVYKVAEKLSLQERRISENACIDCADSAVAVRFSAPERYRKFPHLFNIHSWAPVYFSYDNIKNLSYDHFYEIASPGVAAVMQNNLGTFTASFGYSAHKDPYDRNFWRHSGHAKFTYSGLYPVIEASVDINDRAARNYFLSMEMVDMQKYLVSLKSYAFSIPSVRGRVSAYIPFNFSSGGWYLGVVPQIAWSASNDLYIGKLYQTMTASVRAYTMLGTAVSEIYPDLGIGVEGGISGYIGLSEYFSPVAYGYVYGYLPGFFSTHGFRLTATGQWQTDRTSLFSSSIVNTLPRGLSRNDRLSSYMAGFNASCKFTAEYAMPVYLGDFSLSSAFYVKRAVITPHFDLTVFPGGSLYSAGVSAAVEFGCFFWIGTPISIGLTYSYNGGRSFGQLNASGYSAGRHYIGPVFNISLPQ